MTTTPTDHRALAAHMMFGQREIGRQEAAGPVDHWCPTGVPGYMQTEEYATAVLRAEDTYTDDEAAQAVADRMVRTSILRTITEQPRRVLVTRAGIERPILTSAAMSRQWAQLADLARLDHVDLRVLPPYVPVYPTGFQILHGAPGGRVLVEGPTGGYTPPGEPAQVQGAYQSLFSALWKMSNPYPG
ncbi:DUF5753 domain-containing protein (plasmid) [Nocardiopsis exhalans]|uniref:DUF5753 domain-containing protein n=1 Tax=Nocardiopsis exhalans TaxID=163604 RepID=A0ABY5DGY6_9ACTN|nr:Scr1 family TA system antitoxin-like transcriptional regulator [Nocardiopsis exhalans]USY23584.1 DUF5753 domain-containing protein [Nocardiopsis exhalans]